MIATFFGRFIAPYALPILGAVALLGWGLAVTFKLQIEGLRIWPIHIVGWREENATLKLDLSKIKDAQATAKAKQEAQDAANYRSQIEHNRSQADEQAKLESARRDAVARYVATHRLRGQEAPGGSPGRSDPAGVHRDTEPAAGPATAATVVTITAGELDQLTAKAVRDTDHQRFLNGLIAQGLAVPERE